jgi:uncharacterized protein
MKKIILMFLLVIYSSAFAASFDCSKASNTIEKTICSDSEMSELDEKLSILYKQSLISRPDLKSEQIQWIRETRQCEKSSEILDCVKTSYENRIEYIKTLSANVLSKEREADVPILQKNEQEIRGSEKVNQNNLILEKPNNETQDLNQQIDPEANRIKITESTILIFLILIGIFVYFFKKIKSKKVEESEVFSSSIVTLSALAVDDGDEMESIFNKGVFLYEKGDFEKAFDLLQKSASNEHPASQFYLGKILIRNAESEDSPSYTKGIEWFEKSAKNDYQPAINELSLIVNKKIMPELNVNSVEEEADDLNEFLLHSNENQFSEFKDKMEKSMEYEYLYHINLGSILDEADDLIECFNTPGILILSTAGHENTLVVLDDGTIKEFEHVNEAYDCIAKYLANLDDVNYPESLILGLITSALEEDEDGMYDIIENDGGTVMLSKTINIENLTLEAQEDSIKSELANKPFCLVQFTDSTSIEIKNDNIIVDGNTIDFSEITGLSGYMDSLDYSVCVYIK